MLQLVKLFILGMIAVGVLFFFGVPGTEETYGDGYSTNHNSSSNYTPEEIEAPADTGDKSTTWTVMIYMCGSDLESENALATANLQELEAAEKSDNVNVVVEAGGAKKWNVQGLSTNKLNRIELTDNGLSLVEQQPLASMGESSTLVDFLQWGVQDYKADKYMLVFWDHGGGTLTGVCADELYSKSSSTDTLTLPEMRSALKKANVDFEVIGFDTCLMATLETAEILDDCAKYMVASEETEPGYGWEYTSWINYLSEYPGTDTVSLCKGIIDSYQDKCEHWWVSDSATLSAIDLSKIEAVSMAFQNATDDIAELTGSVSRLREFTQCASRAENYGGNTRWDGYTDMVDLKDLMENTSSVLSNSAQYVINAVEEAVVYNYKGRYRTEADGISVFYPLYIDQSIYQSYAQISTNTSYLQFLAVMAGNYSTINWRSDAAASVTGGTSRALNLDPVTEDDYTVTYERDFDEDGYLQLNIQKGKSAVKNVLFNLGFVDEDNNYVYLGSDNNLDYDFENGVFTDNFQGKWLSFNGSFCSPQLISENANYNLYSVPVKINGETASLRVIWNWETSAYEVLGYCDPVDEASGTVSKSFRMPDEGDKITFLFYATNLDTNKDTILEGDTVTWTDDIPVKDRDLMDGDYYYTFEIEDLFGNVDYSDAAVMTVDGEDIYVEL